ncbi:trans-aconitate 2-methyltransferase [Komagataeibacter sp. FNDCR2]|uniref:class I SAM-dependent methyltransferase n=1 Tax=Komagataeibacter sp. FNDCR2 TaxID=2878682 RepID=UPI001E5F4916|nr:class I SAM-dependent methyltransferase [Komagataeibacter sp. FNDCR2]MCE2574087.1 class I SAM-dependent methyltransferase [Komagataeibacter sp. FNDCR2]
MTDTPSPERIIAEFWQKRSKLARPDAARYHAEHTEFDCQFVRSFCTPGTRVLDLGCGTLTLANWLVETCGAHVHAVDSQANFLKSAVAHPALTTECADLVTYQPSGQSDVILLFGVIQHIIDVEARQALYTKLSKGIAPDGHILIKSQFGVEGPVEVNHFSTELGSPYYSLYPGLKDEIALLSRWFDVTAHDIYPREFSPYPNTRFMHLSCRMKR